MLLAERLHQRPELSGQAFNFSIESEVTVVDLVNRILRAVCSDLKPVVLNEASNEIRRQFLSAPHARKAARLGAGVHPGCGLGANDRLVPNVPRLSRGGTGDLNGPSGQRSPRSMI
jgi:hypothetical protein